MKTEQLIANYPRLWHMAEDGTWPSLQRHGLLSTMALLDLYEIKDPRRAQIESAHRPESISINHRAYGPAVIRDQKPMTEDGLLRFLEKGLTPY